nr:hypothetical protein [Tanacetum cinerariifolium]
FGPPAIIFKQLGEICNFKQEDGESLFYTWERYNDLLFKFPFHDLNDHQKVNTFYNGLKGQTRQIVDFNGLIPGLTASEALKSIQELADHSHKWHNEESIPTSFGIISDKLKALNHEMDELKVDVRKINTNKEMKNLHEEIKSIRTSEISYEKSYPKSNIHPTNLKDTFEHYLKESCKRQYVLNEWMKKFMNTKMNFKDHNSSIKRLEENVNHLTHELPSKENDPGRFILLFNIGSTTVSNALADLRASISVMPFSLFKRLGLGNPKPINMVIEMADRSMQSPKGIIENVLSVFPVDFIIVDMIEDDKVPIILRRPMLATAHARIDVFGKKISLEVGIEQITFDVNERESLAVLSPVYVINIFSEINRFDEPGNLEELFMSDDINMDLGSFLEDNDLLPDLESQDTMSFHPQDDRVNGVLWFKIKDEKTIFNMPNFEKRFGKLTVRQHNTIGPILKISDEDKSKGIHQPYQKLKEFYRGCLELGEEYKHDQEVIDWIKRRHAT